MITLTRNDGTIIGGYEAISIRQALTDANLTDVDIRRANLRDADLRDADLTGANLRRANLRRANLTGANLTGADLTGANLRRADLNSANLTDADLRRANLRDANLTGANLTGADLSGATGLSSPSDWMAEHFETTTAGYLVFKRVDAGSNGLTLYSPPGHWVLAPGSVLRETANPTRTTVCGCGVNFGTLAWCQNNHKLAQLWRCLIRWPWLPGVVVPFNTDGKARCERLELIAML